MHFRLLPEVHMTEIELTNEQRQALQTERGKPVDVVDPATHERYVLLARELYDRVRDVLDREAGRESADVAPEIAPGILRVSSGHQVGHFRDWKWPGPRFVDRGQRRSPPGREWLLDPFWRPWAAMR
jgi:hypothetical protein